MSLDFVLILSQSDSTADYQVNVLIKTCQGSLCNVQSFSFHFIELFSGSFIFVKELTVRVDVADSDHRNRPEMMKRFVSQD